MDEKRIFVEILSGKKAKVIDEKISRYYQFIFRDAEGKIIKKPEYKLNEWEEESRPPFKRNLSPEKDVKIEYDDRGLKLAERLYDKDGNVQHLIKYFYNDIGLVSKKVIFRMGKEDMKIYFDYDNRGRLIKSETFNRNGKLEDYERYEYDEYNNPVYEETLLTYPDKIGMEIFQGRYENKYDNDGTLVSRMEKNRMIYFDF